MKTATILAAAMGLVFGAEDKKPAVAPVVPDQVQLRVANAQLEKANLQLEQKSLQEKEAKLNQEFSGIVADLSKICGDKFHADQPQSFGTIGSPRVVCVPNPESVKTEKK